MTAGSGDQKPVDRFDSFHRKERVGLGLYPVPSIVDGIGLALSGGGIRSACFALGVVQSLMNASLWSRFDYLSTVSGGGYLGAGLSWWAHHAAIDQGLPEEDRYSAFRQQFGSKVKGARTVTSGVDKWPAVWRESNWLAYIRQHGNYLRPPGVSVLSLVGSALRVCLYSIFVYLAAATGVFGLFEWLASCHDVDVYRILGKFTAGAVSALIALVSLLYGPATWFASTFKASSDWLYKSRTRFRQVSGALLGIAVAALIFWSVPVFKGFLNDHLGSLWRSIASMSSLGAIGSAYQFWVGRTHPKSPPTAFGQLRVVITAALVLYGLLLTAYAIAHDFPGDPYSFSVVLLAVAAFFGLFVNINFAGISRLYRDRLMEAFLPELASVADNVWALAQVADVKSIADLRGHLGANGELREINPAQKECQRPLHLVNCNVVLIDSRNDLYRNRGGDSFVISSLSSGGNAINWVSTREIGDQAMSLATAMSISGAAANPDAAPNGHGVTRNRLVSFLMSIFSARLGYWLPNPACKRWVKESRPNLWFPGARQGLLGRGLHERAAFLELTDGGHFDNTGLYELVRRRAKLIVVSEAGYDPECAMDDLANAIEKVRVDFSVFIEFKDARFDLRSMRPSARGAKESKRGFAIARVRYPNSDPTSPEFEDGFLVYIQAVPIECMPPDVDSFRRQNTCFPNTTTADQFFYEQELEAYRELGYAITAQFCETLSQQDGSIPCLKEISDSFRSRAR
jgi:hypothetical protein